MNKDKNGIEVLPGDVLLEVGSGGGYDPSKYKLSFGGVEIDGFVGGEARSIEGGIEFFFIKLWEFPKENDSFGYLYNFAKGKYKQWHYSLKNSYKINFEDFPKEFKYSFYHGMSSLQTSLKDGSAKELIEESDWKERIVKEEEVSSYIEKVKIKIRDLNDIEKNIKLLSAGEVPYKIMIDVLRVFNINKTNPNFNERWQGEIGIAYTIDYGNYIKAIQFVIEQMKERGVYFENKEK